MAWQPVGWHAGTSVQHPRASPSPIVRQLYSPSRDARRRSHPFIASHAICIMSLSVAAKRLFSEYRGLLSSPPDGITAGPVNEDDLFLWEALIQGPEGTPFEGGIFPAELKFPKDYPLNPPKMKFLGEIWHPNGKRLGHGEAMY